MIKERRRTRSTDFPGEDRLVAVRQGFLEERGTTKDGWGQSGRMRRGHPPGRRTDFSDFELMHQLLQLGCQFGQSLCAFLHMAAALADLG